MTKFQLKDYFFEDTVLDFYKSSNEIESFFEIFRDRIIPKLPSVTENFKWLDVGIGDGEKLLRILSLFVNRPKITFLEPSKKWMCELIKSGNLTKLQSLTDIQGVQSTFSDYMNNRINFEFDLISFIQVLYKSDIVFTLFDLIENRRNIKPLYLLINVENEENDFFKIRKEISDNGFDIPLSQISILEHFLHSRKIDYNKFYSINKKLFVSNEEIIYSKNHWFYPFILGCSNNDFKNIPYNLKKKYVRIINSAISNKSHFNINDVTLLINL